MKQAVSVPEQKPGQTYQEWIEELAEFFDNTDGTDIEGEEVFDFPLGTVDDMAEVVFRLPHAEFDIIKRRAEQSSVHYSTLLRMIVQTHLRNPLTYTNQILVVRKEIRRLTAPNPSRYGAPTMDNHCIALPVEERSTTATASGEAVGTWSFYFWWFTTPSAALAGRSGCEMD